MSKPQILIVHGGETFKTYEDYLEFLRNMEVSLESKKKWKDEFLDDQLGDDFQIIRPQFPQALNSKYDEWKIIFNKYLEIAKPDILIGISLGGMFLAKYLSENKLGRQAKHVYLVAPVFDDRGTPAYELAGGFVLGDDLSLLGEQSGQLTFMFSKDDDVVPLEQMEKFRAKLPNAEYIVCEGKNGHFLVEEFPEIVEIIKRDS